MVSSCERHINGDAKADKTTITYHSYSICQRRIGIPIPEKMWKVDADLCRYEQKLSHPLPNDWVRKGDRMSLKRMRRERDSSD